MVIGRRLAIPGHQVYAPNFQRFLAYAANLGAVRKVAIRLI